MAKKNQILGLPWWVWVGGGAALLYFATRKKAKAAVPAMPSAVIPLSKLQDQLAAEIATSLGMKKSSLIINIGGAAGPVTVKDRRNGNTILTTKKSPETLLKFVKADGLDKYYVDPMGPTSLWEHGWIATPITV
jgi:hypothetical protein